MLPCSMPTASASAGSTRPSSRARWYQRSASWSSSRWRADRAARTSASVARAGRASGGFPSSRARLTARSVWWAIRARCASSSSAGVGPARRRGASGRPAHGWRPDRPSGTEAYAASRTIRWRNAQAPPASGSPRWTTRPRRSSWTRRGRSTATPSVRSTSWVKRAAHDRGALEDQPLVGGQAVEAGTEEGPGVVGQPGVLEVAGDPPAALDHLEGADLAEVAHAAGRAAAGCRRRLA